MSEAHAVTYLNILGSRWRLYEHEGRYVVRLDVPDQIGTSHELEVTKEQARAILEHFTDGEYTVL